MQAGTDARNPAVAAARPFERLRSSRDVLATLRARHRATPLVVAHVRVRSDDDAPARLTVVASRKVGTAVRRNRAKRLLREAARRQAWAPGHDVVLVARAATPGAHLDDVLADLDQVTTDLDVVR